MLKDLNFDEIQEYFKGLTGMTIKEIIKNIPFFDHKKQIIESRIFVKEVLNEIKKYNYKQRCLDDLYN